MPTVLVEVRREACPAARWIAAQKAWDERGRRASLPGSQPQPAELHAGAPADRRRPGALAGRICPWRATSPMTRV